MKRRILPLLLFMLSDISFIGLVIQNACTIVEIQEAPVLLPFRHTRCAVFSECGRHYFHKDGLDLSEDALVGEQDGHYSAIGVGMVLFASSTICVSFLT